jgi:hypothetical protein
MLFFMVPVLSGCAMPFWTGYGSEGRSKEEFAQYVEDVFRLQNNVTSQIMILLENGDIKSQQQPILKAEQHMQELCSPINEYASRERDGLNRGLLLRRRVEKSAEDCDKAAQEVELLLKRL